MFIPDVIRQCVLFLGNKDNRTGRFRPRATAFIVSIHDGGLGCRFLVTAEHTVAAFKQKGWEFWVRTNCKNGGVSEEKLSSDLWWFHPDENNHTDVAVTPIEFRDDEEFKSILIRSENEPPQALGALAGTAKILAERKLGIGDEVFITGLFRSHYGQKRNVPVVRVGNIAMMTGEPVFTEYCGPTDAYLIEARSISGLSGSPVFVHAPLWQHDEKDNKTTPSIGPRFYLLGLMHGHFDVQNLNEDIVSEREKDATSGINTGIGVVIPVEKIIETIDHPELVEMRKESAKLYRKKFGATADVDTEADVQPNGENPTHREDFIRLLGEAARKPEPKG